MSDTDKDDRKNKYDKRQTYGDDQYKEDPPRHRREPYKRQPSTDYADYFDEEYDEE